LFVCLEVFFWDRPTHPPTLLCFSFTTEDICASFPCGPNAVSCVSLEQPGTFTCYCKPGWTVDSSINGTCSKCAPGWNYDPLAQSCVAQLDPCQDNATNPCNSVSNSYCDFKDGIVSCSCSPGYTPSGLECIRPTRCTDVDCGHGTCIVENSVPTCKCDEGYRDVIVIHVNPETGIKSETRRFCAVRIFFFFFLGGGT
jgi:hypothetical protein